MRDTPIVRFGSQADLLRLCSERPKLGVKQTKSAGKRTSALECLLSGVAPAHGGMVADGQVKEKPALWRETVPDLSQRVLDAFYPL